jgi:DNA-binding IclR family transcriptional regulator
MGIDRRQRGRRADVVRAVVTHIVQNANTTVTLEDLQTALQVPPEAATRIVERLVSAGVVRQVKPGVWMRVPELPPARA